MVILLSDAYFGDVYCPCHLMLNFFFFFLFMLILLSGVEFRDLMLIVLTKADFEDSTWILLSDADVFLLSDADLGGSVLIC